MRRPGYTRCGCPPRGGSKNTLPRPHENAAVLVAAWASAIQRLSDSGSAASPRRRRYTTARIASVGVALRLQATQLQLHSQASVPYPSIEMSWRSPPKYLEYLHSRAVPVRCHADIAAQQECIQRLTRGLEAVPHRAQTWAERSRSQVRAAAAVCLRAGCSQDTSTATRRPPSHVHFLHHRQQTGGATWCRLQSQSNAHRGSRGAPHRLRCTPLTVGKYASHSRSRDAATLIGNLRGATAGVGAPIAGYNRLAALIACLDHNVFRFRPCRDDNAHGGEASRCIAMPLNNCAHRVLEKLRMPTEKRNVRYSPSLSTTAETHLKANMPHVRGHVGKLERVRAAQYSHVGRFAQRVRTDGTSVVYGSGNDPVRAAPCVNDPNVARDGWLMHC